MVKYLLVEDERFAYEELKRMMQRLRPSWQLAGWAESVEQAVLLLRQGSLDLMIVDIRLSDGLSFEIFEQCPVDLPVIFTTAYDEYAIKAFKVNSIDYLLKPIKVEDIRHALDKYGKLNRQDILQYLSQLTRLVPAPKYKDKLLVPYKDKLLPVNLKDVSCFYTSGKNTSIYLKDGASYPYSRTLEQIMPSLNPADFTRANKQFIINRDSISNITIWFDSRLLVTLDVEVPERIYVSKNKASEFKAWLVND